MFKALLFLLLIDLSIQKCKDSSPLCLSCQNDQCQECIYSFINQGKCSVSSTSIKNCMFYTSQNQCSFCNPQFTLKDNKCISINVVNCKHSQKQNECLVCQDKLKLSVDNQCTDTCKIKNCKNCAVDILNNEFCAVCENGYSLNQSLKCQVEPIPHCDKVVKDNCVRCKVGYRHDGQKCHKVDYEKYLKENSNKQNDVKKQQQVLLKSSKYTNDNTTKNNQTKTHTQNYQTSTKKNSATNVIPTQKNTHSNQKTTHHTHQHNTHHHNQKHQNQQQQNKSQSSKIIVNAEKLLNESRVNLNDKSKSNAQKSFDPTFYKMVEFLFIVFLFNQFIYKYLIQCKFN